MVTSKAGEEYREEPMQPCPWVADIARLKAFVDDHQTGPEFREFLSKWGAFQATVTDLTTTTTMLTATLQNGINGRLRTMESKLAWLLGALFVVWAIATAGLSLGIKWFVGH